MCAHLIAGILLSLALACGGGKSSGAPGSPPPGSTTVTQPNGSLQGRRPFPADNPWNTDISSAPVDPNSATLLASIGLNTGLHPDFGTVWAGAPNGIPYVLVSGTQPLVPMTFDYADESDPGPYPIPPDAPIEGGPSAVGDRHVLVVDLDHWKLFETWDSTPLNGGASWHAGSGAVFDLSSDALRTAGWTSADAAGLPIFPGLVRYDEVVEQGSIQHALRFTVAQTRMAYVPPPGTGPRRAPARRCRPWACGCGSRRRPTSAATRPMSRSSCAP